MHLQVQIDLSYWKYKVKRNWERWDWETIYRNRKKNQLSTHRDLREVESYSWREKAKALGYFFKKLTKSLIDRDQLRNCKQT